MDPYLEGHWRDVHHRLITYASDAIQVALPAELRARVEERVVSEDPEGPDVHPPHPDQYVIKRPPQQQGDAKEVARSAATEPILISAERDSLTTKYIEIIDAGRRNRVITIVEVLSPATKTPGHALQAYRRQQCAACQTGINLVEIDLLRAGRHVVAVPLENIPAQLRTRYLVCVRRAAQRSKAEVYPVFLSEKLPTVKVPLRTGDADAPLDLQALIEQCYRNGRYEGDLDYRHDPEPPWTGPDTTWVIDLLCEKGHRPAAPPKKKRPRKPPRAADDT
jgi:hypothetical protein